MFILYKKMWEGVELFHSTVLIEIYLHVNCSLGADSTFNLREENRQLRKTHQDIHMQLQDARVRNNILSVCYILLWPFDLCWLTQSACAAAFEVFPSIALKALPSRECREWEGRF